MFSIISIILIIVLCIANIRQENTLKRLRKLESDKARKMYDFLLKKDLLSEFNLFESDTEYFLKSEEKTDL